MRISGNHFLLHVKLSCLQAKPAAGLLRAGVVTRDLRAGTSFNGLFLNQYFRLCSISTLLGQGRTVTPGKVSGGRWTWENVPLPIRI